MAKAKMEDQTIAGIPGTRKRIDFTFLVRLLDLPFNVYIALLWAMNEGEILTQQNKLLTWLFQTQSLRLAASSLNTRLFEDLSNKFRLSVCFPNPNSGFLHLILSFTTNVGTIFGELDWDTGTVSEFTETVYDFSLWPFLCDWQDQENQRPLIMPISRERFFTILYHFFPKWT